MISPDDIERDFDTFFEGIGFRRVTLHLGQSPTVENADYYHPLGYVVELKVLDKDYFQRGGVIHRLNTLVVTPKQVKPDGTGQYEFVLPGTNREGTHDSFEEPLRRVLKKANRQIRSTIDVLLGGEGAGLVVLALNLKTPIDPEPVMNLACLLLEKEFSSIAGIIVCTPSWALKSPNTQKYHRYCLVRTPQGCPKGIESTFYGIAEQWCAFADGGGHDSGDGSKEVGG